MTTKAFYVPRGIEVDFGDVLPNWLYTELASLHGQIGRTDPPILTCGANGLSLYVYRHQNGRYFARHWPGENPDNHDHGALRGMSVEHQRQAEYELRSAEVAGLRAEAEYSTGNGTRLDVAVFGDKQAGLEIQRSHLSRSAAKRRARLSLEAGWTSAWITDRDTLPDWAYRVPTARLKVDGMTRPINWAAAMPAAGTVDVVIDHFESVRDSSAKGGWRLRRSPRLIYFDELSVRMATGLLVPVRYGNKDYVGLADVQSAAMIDEISHVGASRWNPKESDDIKRTREAPQRRSLDCHNPHTVTDQAELVRERIEVGRREKQLTMQPRFQCPGCPAMHAVSPCFPGCHRSIA